MDGAPPPEEDFSKIALPERSVHKNWKARLSAYTDLNAKFALTTSDDDPFFRPYLSDPDLLKKWATDSNVVAQEKGVEALSSLVRESGETSARLRSDVYPSVVDKCFGSARASLKLKAIELGLLWIEVESSGEGLVADVLRGLEAKQPKIVQSSVTCLREIVAAFGIKTIGNPKPLLNAIPKIFGHTDKVVRSEGTLLVQQLHLFLGASLTPFLQDLKPIQISELTESFNSLAPGGSGQPSRATRKQQREMQERELATAATGGGGGGAAAEVEDEPLDIQPDAPPPVDILPRMPADFFDQLGSTKWKDRLETLQAVHALITAAPSLVDADFGAHIQAISKRIPSDANINVVIAGANVLEGLGKGLGPAFGKYRSTVMPPLLERLKERKVNVTDALGAALDATFESSGINECTEDILNSLKSKNPQVKEGALKFLNRCLKSTREAPSKESIKPLSDALAVCTGDSAEPVRAASAESLGLMMKILGERQFAPVLEGLDDLRKGKVRECFEKAEVKFKSGVAGGGARPAAAAPVAKAPIKKPNVLKPKPTAGNVESDDADDLGPPPKPLSRGTGFGSEFPGGSNGFGSEFPDESAPPPKPAARPPAPKPVARKPPAPAAPAVKKPLPAAAASLAAKAKAPPTANTPEPLKFKFSAEDAEARWQDVIPADMRAELADGNWKLRLEGGEKMTAWLDEGHASDVEAEVFFRFFSKVPGWSEKNFQVSSKIYGMMVLLAEKSPTFSKACIAIAVGHLTEKLGDIKLKKPAGDALTTFAEKTSLSFVLEQAYEPLTKAKSPKTQADALVWVNQLLLDFGIAGVSMRPLIDFLKTNLKSSNAAVRANATKAMVTVKICVGTDISSFLDDLNPQLLATIEKEFAKVQGQSPPEPTRTSADLKVVAAGAGGKGGASAADALDDLIPRVDLDKLVSGTSIAANSRSDNWKVRKEAMETLSGILQANTRLKPGMGEIGSALKGRLPDTNIMVKLLALDNISKIAAGMGKPFEKHAKPFVTPVCAILADQKAPTRAAATATLSAMAGACEGIDLMVPSFGTSLENPNPLLRASLLAFLLEWYQDHDPAVADLTPIMKPLISCIEDRNADVRKNASALLPLVVSSVGVDFALEQTANLKPAMRQTIVPIIQAAQLAAPPPPPLASTAPTSAPSSAAPASAAVSPPRPASSASSNQSSVRTNGGAASPVKRSVPTSAAGLPARRGVMGAIPKPAASTLSALQRPSSRATTSSMEDEAGPSRPKPAGLKRPLSMAGAAGKASSRASSAASNLVDRANPPFRTADPAHKAARAKKDASRWVFHEKAEPFHTELLASQMEAHASPELYSLLFSRDHNASVDFVNGIGLVSACFQDMAREADRFGMDEEALRQSLICNLDLILKYAAIRMYDSNTQAISRSIELVEHMIDDFSSGPKASVRHSFDEYELHLLLPTLISKLGDPKFQTRIQDLFRGKMRYVVAASKLFHVLVVQGLPLKNAKARVEALKAMTTIVKQIGTETTLTRESVAAVIRCLQDGDGKIRNGALDVLGEAYKTAGEGIYEFAKIGSKERDAMEARFKHVQGPLPDKHPIGRVASGEAARTGSPAANRVSRIAPSSSPAPRQPPSRGESPEKPALASPVKASISPRPSSGSATPVRGIPRFGAPASRPLSMMQPRQSASSSSQLPPPLSEADSASAPVAKPRTGQLFAPLPGRNSGSQEAYSNGDSTHEAVQAIRSILSSDPSRSVDGLKRVQRLLETQHDRFQGSVDDLVQALVKQIRLVFDTPSHLSEPPWFRLAKHLIQTLNNFCDHVELLKEVDEKDMEELLFELTSRLLQTDDATGDAKELSRFLNMIILRIFNGGKREIIFSALFVLLKRVTISFVDEGTLATSRQAKHAELILKCIWKRARSVEDDLGDGILDPIALLRIIEDFLQSLPPTEWRRRAQTSIPLGDMPLRTVKVIIQHVVSKYGGERVYDQLSAAFDEPENTHAYAYIFRLVNQTAQAAVDQAPEAARPESSASHAAPAASNDSRQSSATAAQPAGPQIAIADDVEQEMSDIVQAVVKGDSLQKRIEELSRILSEHPNKRGKFDELVAHIDPALSVFLKRALANRMPRQGSESPAVSHVATSPPSAASRSPTSPSQHPSRLAPSMTLVRAEEDHEDEVD